MVYAIFDNVFANVFIKIAITLNGDSHEILEKTSKENDIQSDHSELEKQSRVTKSIKLV